MLKQLSRLEKTRNFILLAFVVLMAVSLIFFYAPRSGTEQSLTRSQETVASVGGETITVGDVATAQENMRRQYAQIGAGIDYQLPVKQMLEGEIGQRIVRLEAARLGLAPTDEEVAVELRKQLKAGGIDPNDTKKYQQLALENFGGVEKLEQGVRDQLSREKLTAYLTSGVSVSEDEVVEGFNRTSTTFDLVYVPVTAPALAAKLQPSEPELRDYFEKNKASYFISSAQKKIRYLFINQAKVGEKLDVPEADLRAEYDALDEGRKQKGVQAQQIVLKIPNEAADAQIRAKADSIIQQALKGGATISEEAFADLARGNSNDPATAQAGGKLPTLIRSDPANPTAPTQQMLAVKEGEVTTPIKYGNSYYIFRRGALIPKTFEDAKPELLVSMRNRRAYRAAADLAQKATDRLKEVKDVQRVAQEFSAQANLSAQEMVRETGFVKPGDDVPNVGVSPQFEEGIARLENPNDVGERTPIKDGFAIPLLLEKRDPHEAAFDEVKDQVLAAYKFEKAKSVMEQTAKDIAAGAATPDALRAAAEKAGLKAADAKDYKVGSPLGEGATAATSGALNDAIYALRAGEVAKTPIKAGDNFYVVAAAKRTDPSRETFAERRDQLVESLLSQKKNQVFSDYLANVRQTMDKAGRIKIYQDALAKLDSKPKTEEEES